MNASESGSFLQSIELRAILDDSLRYWEIRRIPYNLVLAGVVIAWAVALRSHLHQMPIWVPILALFVMAALANVLYSVAHCLDVFVQWSSFREVWRRRRWLLWLAGMLLAVALANVWIISQVN